MLLVGGPASTEQAADVAGTGKFRLVQVESKIFPDGESYIRFMEPISGEDVAIIQTTYPGQDKRLVELFLMADNARSQGCRRLFVIAPYLAYARQDQRFLRGEALSIQTIAHIFSAFEVEKVVSVDLHNEHTAKQTSDKFVNVSAAPLFAEWARNMKLDKPFIFAPDTGGVDRARTVAGTLGTDWAAADKQRDRITGMIRLDVPKNVEVEDRTILIVDDVISTGSSMAKLAAQLVEKDAGPIYAAAAHALLAGDALQKLTGSGIKEVVATDTVPSPISKISVAGLLADTISRFA